MEIAIFFIFAIGLSNDIFFNSLSISKAVVSLRICQGYPISRALESTYLTHIMYVPPICKLFCGDRIKEKNDTLRPR